MKNIRYDFFWGASDVDITQQIVEARIVAQTHQIQRINVSQTTPDDRAHESRRL